jgi:hypothetical protein
MLRATAKFRQFVGRLDGDEVCVEEGSGGQRWSIRFRIFSAMIIESEIAHSSAGLGFDWHKAMRRAARIAAVIRRAPLRISFTGRA